MAQRNANEYGILNCGAPEMILKALMILKPKR